MEQDFCSQIVCWYYDPKTRETVLLTRHTDEQGLEFFKTMRILDPMWLINLSKEDQEFMFNARLIVKPKYQVYMDQYLEFLKLCFIHDLLSKVKQLTPEEIEKRKKK